MSAYYNERDPYAAAWLRNLIDAGHIAPGDVDERSIADVRADDLLGYTQCHFFAGIGVWSHALRRAGWPDDKPIWTGSCPCQPFSAAGQQKGFDDERHLWPVWFDLIRQCRPAIVLGEQVASALDWLDLVSADMESAGYAFGASDLCAAGFGGAHIRQRLYFVAMANTDDARSQGRGRVPERAGERSAGASGLAGGMADAASERQHGLSDPTGQTGRDGAQVGGGARRLADADEGQCGRLTDGEGGQHDGTQSGRQQSDRKPQSGSFIDRMVGPRRFDDRGRDWPHAPMLGRNPADWLFCRDGKWRPVEPFTFPLVDAAPARVGRLRAYGNALDAETAAQFCGAVMDCLE